MNSSSQASKSILGLLGMFALLLVTSASAEVQMTIGAVETNAGGTDLTVDLRITGHSVGIRGVEINVGYNSDTVTFKGGEIIDGIWDLSRIGVVVKDESNAQSGQLKVLLAAAADKGIAAGEDATIARLTFDLGAGATVRDYPLAYLESSPGLRDLSIGEVVLTPTSGFIHNMDKLFAGDVNGDARVTPADASGAFQLYLSKEWEAMTGIERFSADHNESASVTPSDASSIFNSYLNQ